MLDRLKVFGAGVAVLLVLVVGFRFSVTAHLIGWALCLYVVVRAAPAIRFDFSRIRVHFFPTRSWRF